MGWFGYYLYLKLGYEEYRSDFIIMSSRKFTLFEKISILILSFIPGCGHMYMGLMKRGMFVLSSFFACSYLASSLFFRVFIIGFIIIWFYGLFDAYNCRKKIDEGKFVEDSVEDIKKFLLKHRNSIIATFATIAVIEINRSGIIFDAVGRVGENYSLKRLIFDNILVFLLICIGLYHLFFRKKK